MNLQLSEMTTKLIAWVVFVVMIGVLLFDAVLMLLAPDVWIRLPPYIGFQGSITEASLRSRQGRLEVRLFGLLILLVFLVLVWIGVKGKVEHFALTFPSVQNVVRVQLALIALTCASSIAYAVKIFLHPDKWLSRIAPQTAGIPGSRATARGAALLCIVLIFYLAWRMF